ncbi:MAG: hypothetical protein ACXQTE_01365 [Methanosarcinaceae archaeon]
MKSEDTSVLIDFRRLPEGIGHVVDERVKMKRIYNDRDIPRIVNWVQKMIGNTPDGTDVYIVGTLPTWIAMSIGIAVYRDTRIGRLFSGVPSSSQFVVFDRTVATEAMA